MIRQQLLRFTFVNKSTYISVVHNVLEVEKQTTRRKKPADSPITGFETAPVQICKRKGNKISMLPYRFDQCYDSRENNCYVEVMIILRVIPHFISRRGVKKYSI